MNYPIILFDGLCNLCNSSVSFIIKRDRKEYFRFLPLQSDTAKKLLKNYNLSETDFNTVVLVTEDEVFTKSAAAFEILKHLRTPLKLLLIFKKTPKFLLDKIYDFISKNRYTWFGKREVCMIPTDNIKKRFIE